MQLGKKKILAAHALGIGKDRVIFTPQNLKEISEAITRQDIIDLHNSGAIKIREISGRRKLVKRKNRRGPGKIKKNVGNKKREYVIITRKLRTFTKSLLRINKIDKVKYRKIRTMIRARRFKSKRHLSESLGEI